MATEKNEKVTNDSADSYCKFPDGTLICYGTVQSGALTANTGKSVTFNFPIAFSIAPGVVLSAVTSDPINRQVAYSSATLTNATVYFMCTTNTSGFPARYIAIGRWK